MPKHWHRKIFVRLTFLKSPILTTFFQALPERQPLPSVRFAAFQTLLCIFIYSLVLCFIQYYTRFIIGSTLCFLTLTLCLEIFHISAYHFNCHKESIQLNNLTAPGTCITYILKRLLPTALKRLLLLHSHLQHECCHFFFSGSKWISHEEKTTTFWWTQSVSLSLRIYIQENYSVRLIVSSAHFSKLMLQKTALQLLGGVWISTVT